MQRLFVIVLCSVGLSLYAQDMSAPGSPGPEVPMSDAERVQLQQKIADTYPELELYFDSPSQIHKVSAPSRAQGGYTYDWSAQGVSKVSKTVDKSPRWGGIGLVQLGEGERITVSGHYDETISGIHGAWITELKEVE